LRWREEDAGKTLLVDESANQRLFELMPLMAEVLVTGMVVESNTFKIGS
jgi:hypothetical protein